MFQHGSYFVIVFPQGKFMLHVDSVNTLDWAHKQWSHANITPPPHQVKAPQSLL